MIKIDFKLQYIQYLFFNTNLITKMYIKILNTSLKGIKIKIY